MTEQTITCPKCGAKIPMTEAFTHEIEDKLKSNFQSEIKKKDEELQRTIEATKKEYRDALNKEVEKVKSQAQQQAQAVLEMEMKDLKTQLTDKSKQLDDAQKQELELRKRQRELEDRERNLKLEVQRTLDAERAKIWEDASKRAGDDQHMKMLEKDKQLADMHKQIEEMKRKI